MNELNFWFYSVALALLSSAVILQIYLLVFKHAHLSPKAVASRWCIAAASMGFLHRLLSVILDPAYPIPNYLIIPIFLFGVGVTGLCVETIYGLKHHNRRATDEPEKV